MGGNQLGCVCPNCGSQNDLYILIPMWAHQVGDGSVLEDGDETHEYYDTDKAQCRRCQWQGLVANLLNLADTCGEQDIPELFWFPSQGWGVFHSEKNDKEFLEVDIIEWESRSDHAQTPEQRQRRRAAYDLARQAGLDVTAQGVVIGFTAWEPWKEGKPVRAPF